MGTDINHIKNVLRYQKGDTFLIGDKNKKETYLVELETIQEEQVICNIKEKMESKEQTIQVDLYQGLPKADKMEWIIQKTTEIGVGNIIPVMMERSIVKLNAKDSSKKIERWQKIAEVAAKQCKREDIPSVYMVSTFKEIQEAIEQYDYFIIAYEEEQKKTLKQILENIFIKENIKIGILIGPEGGIAEKEIEQLKKYENTSFVSLGKNILRTETAPITMISNIFYALEE